MADEVASHLGHGAAGAAADDEPTTTVLKIRDESFETTPWVSVANMQLGRARNFISPDSFVDTVVPGTVLAFKDRSSAPDKTVLLVSAC